MLWFWWHRAQYRIYYTIDVNLTVYVSKSLEQKLRKRAAAAGLLPGRYIQQVVRKALEADGRFSPQFEALAGSWADVRDAARIVRDLKAHRTRSPKRATLK